MESVVRPAHSMLSTAILLLVSPGALAQVPDEQQILKPDAGPDRFVVPPAISVVLSGTIDTVTQNSSDPAQGSGVSILWSQLGGPPVEILTPNALQTKILPSIPGKVRLLLSVSTPESFATDEVSLTVLGDDQDASVLGTARKWHKLALTFTDDEVLSETSTVNPFLDRRLLVDFYNLDAGVVRSVPGFFAADGNAAETSATAGNCWRVNFTPDHAGVWYYLAWFRAGSEVALSLDPEAGVAQGFDGANGAFTVDVADPTAPGFLSKGRLDYVGAHHLRFAETGEAYLQSGAGSPENFFGYYEFDGTVDLGGAFNGLNTTPPFDGLHHYDAHLSDYVDLGVPLWKNGKGRRLFGALNYLSSRGVNSLFALAYNIDGGDGQEVFPWSGNDDHMHFDVSMLDQWERALDHMNRAGIVWHLVTQEFENDHELDGGALGVQRKLYYRELAARFGWANGLFWNLGEENSNTPDERRAFADYIRAIDPGDHPISVHNIVGDIAGTFETLLGTHLELLSVQGHPINTPPRLRQLVLDSAAAGRPWVVDFDEQSPSFEGVVPDAVDFWHDLIRRESLWPTLLGQGGGCSWYFGYGNPNDDLDCEDFRSRDNLWVLTRRAIDFVRGSVPFDEMQHANALATGNDPSVLAKPGEHYLVHLPFGGLATLDLQGASGSFAVSWFDARNGGPLQNAAVPLVSGPGVVQIGAPPGTGDWVAWVRRTVNLAPELESVTLEPIVYEPGRGFAVLVSTRDPNGPTDPLTVTATFTSPNGTPYGTLPLAFRGGRLYSLLIPSAPSVPPGLWRIRVRVRDAGGLLVARTVNLEVP